MMAMRVFVTVMVMMIVPMVMGMIRIMMTVFLITHVIRGLVATQKAQECAAFDPQQAEADQHDQGIADDLDHANRIAHRLCRSAEGRGRNADDGDRRECLKHSRRK